MTLAPTLEQGVLSVTELTARLDGDILVFCSGEREIRDAAEAIRDGSIND